MATCFQKYFLKCIFVLCISPFLWLSVFLSVYQSVVIDILFLLYFQGDVGSPGPPGPVSTI